MNGINKIDIIQGVNEQIQELIDELEKKLIKKVKLITQEDLQLFKENIDGLVMDIKDSYDISFDSTDVSGDDNESISIVESEDDESEVNDESKVDESVGNDESEDAEFISNDESQDESDCCSQDSNNASEENTTTNQTLFERSKKLILDRADNVNKSDFSFVFMGDNWAGDGHTSNAITQEAFKVANMQNPLCVIHGGDTVWTGSPEQFKDGWTQHFQNGDFFIPSFLKIVDQEAPNIPVFVAPGNHESENYATPSFNNFKKYIGPLHFTVNVNKLNLRLIGLYVNFRTEGGTKVYELTDSELEYLKTNLQNAPRFTFVVLHVPPNAGKWKQEFKDPESTFSINVNKFLKIVRGKVSKVLVSHVHLFDTANINDTDFILSGGGGAPLITNHKFHIVMIRIKNGKVTYEMIPIGWSA